MPENLGFYTDNIDNCPDDVKFQHDEKFPEKVSPIVHAENQNELTSDALKFVPTTVMFYYCVWYDF